MISGDSLLLRGNPGPQGQIPKERCVVHVCMHGSCARSTQRAPQRPAPRRYPGPAHGHLDARGRGTCDLVGAHRQHSSNFRIPSPCVCAHVPRAIGLGVRVTRVPPRAGRRQAYHLHIHALSAYERRRPARHWHGGDQRRGPGVRALEERMGEAEGIEA